MIYDKSDAVTHRDAEYASLIEESKEESDTYEISTLAELFNELKDSEQVAVLVHVFSLLGLTVKKTIERIEDVESIEGEKMRQAYNVDSDKENRVQPGPEWVTNDVIAMWYRIDAKAKETGISYTKTANKHCFRPSSVYNTIVAVKRGLPHRDTDLRIIDALAKEMHVSLNYLVHGEINDLLDNDNTIIDKSVFDNIFSLSNSDYLTLLLLALPYLDKAEMESIKADITARVG